ncbi:hypothetical protein [Rhizobium sp. GR12]|uniref:hypothetical protein n=1 Tax=Rhizobium sp. GR12 TaxID=3053925 RepID=UPI002FBD6503
MADSDNSTTLSSVTHRTMLAGMAVIVEAWSSSAFAGKKISGEAFSDPAVILWQRWQDAHCQTENLRRQQQELERKLAKTVGFPRASIRLSGGKCVTAHSPEAIHEVYRLAPEEAVACAKAEEEFAVHKSRWETADQEIGYSAAVRAEREAGDRAGHLLDAMAATSATTLVGVAAKLDALLREMHEWRGPVNHPLGRRWNQWKSTDLRGRRQRLLPCACTGDCRVCDAP